MPGRSASDAAALTGPTSATLTPSAHNARMPSSKIFRSRWAALLWAGGVLWTAYDVASAAPGHDTPANQQAAATSDATGVAVDKDDLAVLANAMGG